MPGKPDRSSLIPFEDEIVELRRRRPPVPYAQIALLLREKYNVTVCRETIFKFVKVRSRGRKVYSYRRDVPAAKKSASRPAQQPLAAGRSPAVADKTPERRSPGKLEFFPSDRYCLTRLPPEEAAAIRKKLEEEGH